MAKGSVRHVRVGTGDGGNCGDFRLLRVFLRMALVVRSCLGRGGALLASNKHIS